MFKNLAALLSSSNARAGRRVFGAENIERYLQKQKRNYVRNAHNSIAKFNRWTGQPHEHEHKREIARHQRQATR